MPSAYPGAAAVILLACLGCGDSMKTPGQRARAASVQLPVLTSTELPFRYPPALYIQRVQGNVTLRLFIDSLGVVVPESVRIMERASEPAFDSAALAGAARLVFSPARRGDRPVGFAVLFPIKFRVPGAPPMPEDTPVVRK
jgi:TonB family protein